jgi:hypothetical protein
MQNAATVLDVTRKRGNSPRQGMITGEPGAGKLACRVREEVGHVPSSGVRG